MRKLHVRNLPILLLWISSFIVTVYVVDYRFMDVYIVPKWLTFGILYSLLFSLCSIYKLKHHAINGIRKYIYLSIVIISFIEAIKGIYGCVLYTYPIYGCFDNVAGYASMQSLGVAFILHFCTKTYHAVVRVFAWIAVAIVISSLVLSQSRAGLLVALTVIIIFVIMASAPQKRHLFICGGGILLVAGLIFCLSVKGDSTEGRKFILSRSWKMIGDRPLLGFGTGGFKLYYMDYQADYFALNEDFRHSVLADNVKHPLNEYIRIIVEYGIVGFLCIVSGILLIYWYIDKKYNAIDPTVSLSLISVALFSLFSYPLQYPHTWLILSLPVFLAYIENDCSGRNWLICHKSILVLGIFAIMTLSNRIHKELEWGNIYHNCQNIRKEELLSRYEELFAYFKTNPYFLYNYAYILYQSHEYNRALLVANECNEYWHDYNLEILRGDIYDSMGDKNHAVYTFINASYMCPNRFMPLHKLFRMALKQQNYNLAKFYAEAILSKPIKIDSPEVQFIINECYNYYHYNKL